VGVGIERDVRRFLHGRPLETLLAASESVLKLAQWLSLRMRRLAMAMWVIASETSMRAS
jgi:hypothetical protein